MEGNLYKSVLRSLSLIPEEYLVQVNAYLESLKIRISEEDKNRKEVLAMAGSWSDMDKADFAEFLKEARDSGSNLFGREIDL